MVGNIIVNNTIPVTFIVNMENENVSANGVHLVGNFQGFNPSSTQMNNINNTNLYEITLQLSSNTSIEYKFLNGNTLSEVLNHFLHHLIV